MPHLDYHRSMALYALLKDYHEVVPALRALREGIPMQPVDDWQVEMERERVTSETEAARHLATGWFNRVFLLYRHGLLDCDDLRLIASPAAARLWLDHVYPLDEAVRERAHGPRDEGAPVLDIVAFWTDFADGQLRVYGAQGAVH